MFGLRREQRAASKYIDLFVKSEQGSEVLNDMAKFCEVGEYKHSNDPIELSRIMGRQEVYSYIIRMCGPGYIDKINRQIQNMDNVQEQGEY